MILENILFTPIDIPKMTLDKEEIYDYFNHRKTRHQGWMWVPIKNLKEPLCKEFSNLFPQIEYFLRLLPFENYDHHLHVDIREQVVEILPHQDPQTKKQYDPFFGPATYKNLILRECLETFYLLPESTNPDIIQYDQRSNKELNYVFPLLPEETNWFAINNHKGFHGSFQTNPKYKKLTLFLSGKIDQKKHVDLIEKSISKFSNYVIYN